MFLAGQLVIAGLILEENKTWLSLEKNPRKKTDLTKWMHTKIEPPLIKTTIKAWVSNEFDACKRVRISA